MNFRIVPYKNWDKSIKIIGECNDQEITLIIDNDDVNTAATHIIMHKMIEILNIHFPKSIQKLSELNEFYQNDHEDDELDELHQEILNSTQF